MTGVLGWMFCAILREFLDDYKPLLEQTAQEIQEIFEINYVTPVELTRFLFDTNVGK